MARTAYAALAVLLWAGGATAAAQEYSLARLSDVAPGIQQDIRYAGNNNFVGRPLAGYEAPVCLLTTPAAQQLRLVSEDLQGQGLTLKVFDCYRPERAVADIVAWAATPGQKMKATYYPGVAKADFFKLGYVAKRSGHSRGSTVDLTLVDAKTGAELDMGTAFDFFGPQSGAAATDLLPEARRNRQILQAAMERRGFKGISAEWWHFKLAQEPTTNAFDIPVR